MWAEEDKLQAFRGQVKSPSLKSYVSRALQWEKEVSRNGSSDDNSNKLKIAGPREATSSVAFVAIEMRKMNNIFLTSAVHTFTGSPLVFLDVPKVDENVHTNMPLLHIL